MIRNSSLSLSIMLLVVGSVLMSYDTVRAQTTDRLVLLEEFTSSTCGPCAGANPGYNALLDANGVNMPGGTVISIKYQMNWPNPGTDPNYNPHGNSRKAVYGINGVPRTVMDGIAYNGSPSNFTQADIDAQAAVPAKLEMEVSYVVVDTTVTVTVIMNPLQDIPSYQKLYVVVIENEVTHNIQTNGETEFYDVVRQILPSAAGTLKTGLTANTADTTTVSGGFSIGNVTRIVITCG